MSQWSEVLTVVARGGLAATLIAAGASKLADIRGFTQTLKALGLAVGRESWAQAMPLGVPVMESGVGALSVAGIWLLPIDVVVFALMTSFVVITAYAMYRAPGTVCRCFGALADSRFGTRGLVRNIGLALVAGLVVWSDGAHPITANGALGARILLVGGYILFGLAVVQASRTLAEVKARMAA